MALYGSGTYGSITYGTASTTGDLVTLADVRTELRITGTTSDALLTRYISAAIDRVESWTGRALRTTTIVATREGGKYAVSLPRTPVASVVSVEVNGNPVTGWTLHAAPGLLYRGQIGSGARWPVGLVTVTYTVTTDTVEDRYRQAVIEYIRYLMAGQRGSTGQPSAGASAEEALARSRQLAGAGGGGFV